GDSAANRLDLLALKIHQRNAKLKCRRSQERIRQSVRIARHEIARERKETHGVRVTADGGCQAAAVQGWRQRAGRLARYNCRCSAARSDVEACVSHKHVLDAVSR